MLPGFRAELIGVTQQFITSIDIDSRGNIYYSLAGGGLYRMSPDTGVSTLVVNLPTEWEGNAGLLGVALLDDDIAVVHYTTPGRGYHRISRIELSSGHERILYNLSSDPDVEGRSVSTEHHGGNLVVAPDGTVYFGIGDFGGFLPASLPRWIAGKIWRMRPNGELDVWAFGLRNPFDVAFDPETQSVIAPDNGPTAGDEINIVPRGGNCGWPFTVGRQPSFEGDVPPAYVFESTVAPTGILRLAGSNSLLRRGYLVGAFVTKAIYFFPDLTRDPVALFENFDGGAVIDVAQSRDGTIFFATGTGIYRLRLPPRGDCNGDDELDSRDLTALTHELADGSPESVLSAPNGAFAGSWGCDVNADNLVDAADYSALARLVGGRPRAVRRR
jgi:hypothetical protein